jgi:hypothetical protein
MMFSKPLAQNWAKLRNRFASEIALNVIRSVVPRSLGVLFPQTLINEIMDHYWSFQHFKFPCKRKQPSITNSHKMKKYEN